ncbi:hypothetical protein [Cryobacterium sp. Y11]|nr:hypothetical protein [Cryobacterium sp. Y11]
MASHLAEAFVALAVGETAAATGRTDAAGRLLYGRRSGRHPD